MRADLARLSVADTPGPPDATPIVKQSLPQPEVQQPQVQQQQVQQQQPLQLRAPQQQPLHPQQQPLQQQHLQPQPLPQPQQLQPQMAATHWIGKRKRPGRRISAAEWLSQTHQAPQQTAAQGVGDQTKPTSSHRTAPYPSSSLMVATPLADGPAMYFSPEKGLQPWSDSQAGTPNPSAQTPARFRANAHRSGMGGPGRAKQPPQPPKTNPLLFGAASPSPPTQYSQPPGGGYRASTLFEGFSGGNSPGSGSATSFGPSFGNDQNSSAALPGNEFSQSGMEFGRTQQPFQVSSSTSSQDVYEFGAESPQDEEPSETTLEESLAHLRAELSKPGTGIDDTARGQAPSLAGMAEEEISFHGLDLPSLQPAPYPPDATHRMAHAGEGERPTSWSKEALNMYFAGWSNVPPRE